MSRISARVNTKQEFRLGLASQVGIIIRYNDVRRNSSDLCVSVLIRATFSSFLNVDVTKVTCALRVAN